MRTRPIYLVTTGLVMAAIAVVTLIFFDPSGGSSAAQEARNPVGDLALGDLGRRASEKGPASRDRGDGDPPRQAPALAESPPAPEDTGPPSSDRMSLTVPSMARVDRVPVRTAPGDDQGALDSGLLHLQGTGFPWERGSNVFIAGHRIGWPGTRSNLVFYDLHELGEGDAVILTDSEGREYRYRVYESFEVSPDRTSVAEPVAGKSVVTLQTCTLPDYSRRIIVRAELEGRA